MKVYLSNYRNHWISPYTILEKIIFWREIQYDEPMIKFWSNVLQPLSAILQKVLDVIHPKIDYVKVDHWDSWSLDHTLSRIILPTLKQLRDTKHGAGYVSDDDVPEELKSTSAPPKKNEWDTDDNHFKRYDYVLDEMIFAFEHLVDESWEEAYWSGEHGKGDTFEEMMNSSTRKLDRDGWNAIQKRINNGLRLFGVYYRTLWD